MWHFHSLRWVSGVANRTMISEAASLAMHSMTVLARNPGQRFTNQGLAQLLNASGHHLAKILQRLARAGLVDSVCGPKGGFQLGRPADEIKLVEIYEVVDGPLDPEGCLLGTPVCDGKDCLLGEVIQSFHRQLRQYMAKTTLMQLAQGGGMRKTVYQVDSGQEANGVK